VSGTTHFDPNVWRRKRLMQQAITACEEAIAANSSSLAAHFTLAKAHWICHLYRWATGPMVRSTGRGQ
jgi:hypothetical protein